MFPRLQGVKAFGTDGEQALTDAFSHEFPFSQRLICSIHVRRNIKDKCSEFHIPTQLSQQILNDVFGVKLGDVFVKGLVDAMDDDDFQKKLDAVIMSWEGYEVSSAANVDGFIQWFKLNKSLVIRDHMLRPIREECGLGCPPQPFTTNASKSINELLNNKVDYKKTELPLFIEKVKDIVKEQQKEVERAIIGRGKYQLRKSYKYLEIPEEK